MLRFFERHSAARCRVALLAMAVPLVMAGAVFIWQDYQARRDAIVTQVGLKSALVNSQLEDFVHTVREASGVFASTWVGSYRPDSAGPSSLQSQNAFLADFVANHPHFSRAFITGADGLIRASSDPSMVARRVGGLDLYERALSARRFTVSDVVAPEGDEPPFALFVQPLFWSDAGLGGFMVLQTDLDTISAVMDLSIGFPSSAKSGIFDSQGRIVAGSGYEAPHPGLAAGRDLSASAVWAQASTHPTGEWFGPGLDEIAQIVFFGYPDSTPWVTTVAFAQSELFDPLRQRLWTFGAVLAATLAGILWVGEILVRRERREISNLEKEQLTLDAVMTGSSDGIMIIDSKSQVSFANRRLGEMFGLRAHDLIGWSFDVVRGVLAAQSATPETTHTQFDRAIRANGNVVVDNLRLKDSIGLELEMTSYELRQSNGGSLGRTIVFHDVTQAAEIQRIRSVFIATASHQLRTPMASIMATSELLLSEQITQAKQTQLLELVKSQSTRMTDMIDTLLNVSLIEAGQVDLKIEEFDARELCHAVVEEFEACSENHHFEVQVADSARFVRADKLRFTQILEDLVDNAVKYSPDFGQITIGAERDESGMVRFNVSDTGVGITTEGLKEIFKPFSRISDGQTTDVAGTGLGLYIAKELTELLGGLIWAESRPGQGTSVYFTMPSGPRNEAVDKALPTGQYVPQTLGLDLENSAHSPDKETARW